MKRVAYIVIILILIFLTSTLFISCKNQDLNNTNNNIQSMENNNQEISDMNNDSENNDQNIINPEFIIRDSLKGKNPRVVDIAMIGAHDAYSMHITKSSQANIHDKDNIANNPTIKKIAKNAIADFSIAQTPESVDLYNNGARYIDIRTTLIDGVYYTEHGLISDTLERYIIELLDFLQTHDGEFFILDFQHFYTEDGMNYRLSDAHYMDLFNFIDTIKDTNNKSLLDYVRYETNGKSLSDIRYNDVTDNATKAGVVILIPNKSINKTFYRDTGAYYEYDGYQNIRSRWHNDFYLNSLIHDVEFEVSYIEENFDLYKDMLRVNQFVTTPFSENAYIQTIKTQSLLNHSIATNLKLIENKEVFNRYINAMPIVLIDYVSLDENNFSTTLVQYIFEYNSSIS